MTAATDAHTDLEILQGLDFDSEEPCNARRAEECLNPAHWRCYTVCCNRFQHQACDMHKPYVEEYCNARIGYGKCVSCGAVWAGIRYEPIKR